MKEILAGMTGLEVRNILNNIRKEYNVKDYGAVGNGIADDTVAIQTTINTAFTNGGGVVLIPIGVYIIGGALQRNINTVDYKSQLYIPEVNYNNALRTNVTIKGENKSNFAQTWGIGTGTVPCPNTCTILRSTLISDVSTSFVIASAGKAANAFGYNYHDCAIEDISIQVTPDINSAITIGGIGFNKAANGIVKNTTIFPYNLSLMNTIAPINGCIGIAMPQVNCELVSYIENCTIGGFESGVLSGEHTVFNNVFAMVCKYGFNFADNNQAVWATHIEANWCINAIYISGAAKLDISHLQVEWDDLGKWYDSVYTVLDATNQGKGRVNYEIVEANVGFNNGRFAKSGGTGLQCMPISFAAAASFTVTGARDETEGALKDLIAKLVAKGIIIDGTTAS